MRLRSVSKGRLLCFDLENRPLAYWYDGETTSEITAFGWKWSDEKHVWSMLLQADGSFVQSHSRTADVEVVPAHEAYEVFVDELRGADIVYGHNIRRHDLPILNAGLIRRQLPTLPPLLTSDTCRDIPKRGGMSVSLENLASLYGLPGKKLTMSQPDWEHANRLIPDGVIRARDRVVSDVLLQERLRTKLLSLELLGAPRMWAP